MVPTWSHAMAQMLLLRFEAGLQPDAEMYNKGCVRSVSLTSLIKPSDAQAPRCQQHCSHCLAKSEATDAGSYTRKETVFPASLHTESPSQRYASHLQIVLSACYRNYTF